MKLVAALALAASLAVAPASADEDDGDGAARAGSAARAPGRRVRLRAATTQQGRRRAAGARVVGEDGKSAQAPTCSRTSRTAVRSAPASSARSRAWDLSPLQAAPGDQVVFPLAFHAENRLTRRARSALLVPMAARRSGASRFSSTGDHRCEPAAQHRSRRARRSTSSPAAARAPSRRRGSALRPAKAASRPASRHSLEAATARALGCARRSVRRWRRSTRSRSSCSSIRAHGDGTGQKIVHGETAKSYPLPGGKAAVKLLLDGTGARWPSTSSTPKRARPFRRTSTRRTDEVLVHPRRQEHHHRRQAELRYRAGRRAAHAGQRRPHR